MHIIRRNGLLEGWLRKNGDNLYKMKCILFLSDSWTRYGIHVLLSFFECPYFLICVTELNNNMRTQLIFDPLSSWNLSLIHLVHYKENIRETMKQDKTEKK